LSTNTSTRRCCSACSEAPEAERSALRHATFSRHFLRFKRPGLRFVASAVQRAVPMPIVTTSHLNTPEIHMSASLLQRGFSFCISAVLTLAMLGGIDHLTVHDEGGAGWARNGQATQPRA
jgi:hypothetical protein